MPILGVFALPFVLIVFLPSFATVRRVSGTHARLKFCTYEVIDFVAAVKFRFCGRCNAFVMCLCVPFLGNALLWLILAFARGWGEGSTVTSISLIPMNCGV